MSIDVVSMAMAVWQAPIEITAAAVDAAIQTLNRAKAATITFRQIKGETGWIVAIGSERGAYQLPVATIEEAVMRAHMLLVALHLTEPAPPSEPQEDSENSLPNGTAPEVA